MFDKTIFKRASYFYILMSIIMFLLISMLYIMPCEAKVQVYTGIGRHAMGEDDSPRMAKDGARANALRNIAEQIFVYVEGTTEVDKGIVTKDLAITKTVEVLSIIGEPEYYKEDNDIMVCRLRAEANPESIVKDLINKIQNQDNIIHNQHTIINNLTDEKREREKLHKFGNTRSILVEVNGIMSFRELTDIIERLRRISSIDRIAIAHYDPKTRHVILDTDYLGDLRILAAQIGKHITVNSVKKDAVVVSAH